MKFALNIVLMTYLICTAGCAINGQKIDWFDIAIEVLVEDECDDDCCCCECRDKHRHWHD